MRHCCEFKPNDVYFLAENDLYSSRKLSIGFCPICKKPVAELVEIRFDGKYHKLSLSGISADRLVLNSQDEILYSMKECNYQRLKSKPFGWKYGINKSVKVNGKIRSRQYACDFYGNKEFIKAV
jgi:hypothetical protein